MGTKQKISETDLAAPVVVWLSEQNWNIYQEVEFPGRGGVADIVAERHGILWIIECKTSYSFAVLNQASRWPAHYRSVAVPMARSKDRDYKIAADYYRVGVIEVGWTKSVHEVLRPHLFIRHHHDSKEMLNCLTELHKSYAPAGSPSGYHLTPYKQTMIAAQEAIQNNPGCTIKDLFNILGKRHYYSKSSFKGNMLKCLSEFESEWCRIDTSVKPYKFYIRNKNGE